MQPIALLTLGFPPAPNLKFLTMLHTITRRTILQKVPDRTFRSAFGACKHRVSGSFHSPPGVLFTFPSQYFSTIGHRVVFRLGGWSPQIPCGFLVPARTLDTDRRFPVSTTRLSLSPAGFPTPFVYRSSCLCLSVTPAVFLPPVWPAPLSLAATHGISVDFFSSGYLDVSVHRVPSVYLWIQYTVHEVCSCGFPHSDIYGSRLICSSP